MNVPIQNDTTINLLIGLLFCVVILAWTFWSDYKARKRDIGKDIYEKSLSWRVYLIGGFGFFIFLSQILKRVLESNLW